MLRRRSGRGEDAVSRQVLVEAEGKRGPAWCWLALGWPVLSLRLPWCVCCGLWLAGLWLSFLEPPRFACRAGKVPSFEACPGGVRYGRVPGMPASAGRARRYRHLWRRPCEKYRPTRCVSKLAAEIRRVLSESESHQAWQRLEPSTRSPNGNRQPCFVLCIGAADLALQS